MPPMDTRPFPSIADGLVYFRVHELPVGAAMSAHVSGKPVAPELRRALALITDRDAALAKTPDGQSRSGRKRLERSAWLRGELAHFIESIGDGTVK